MKKVILLLGFIVFNGCVSIYNPVPKDYTGNTSTIYDSHKLENTSQASFFQVYQINGNEIETSSSRTYSVNYGRGLAMNPIDINRSVPSKMTTLSLEGITYHPAIILSFGADSNNIKGDVNVSLEKDESYFVKGYLSNNYQAVWLEDNNCNVVSKKISKGIEPEKNQIYTLDKKSSEKSLVKIFNVVGGLEKLVGLDIYVNIDGKDYGTIEPKEYMTIELSIGNHILKLAHWDMFKMSSKHTINITKNKTFLGVATSGLNHVVIIQNDMPNDFVEAE